MRPPQIPLFDRALASEFAKLSQDILGPIRQVPRHRFLLARFGLPALLPASALARHYFTGKRAQAFLPAWQLIPFFH
jgi:hypothetical protein